MKTNKIVESLTEDTKQITTILRDSTKDICSFKKNEETWSIFEVLEHLIMVETGVIANIQKLLSEKPANALEKPATHDVVIERSVSRDVKVNAPEVFIPKGMFDNINDAISAFQAHRNKTSEFISTNTLDLSLIAFPHPRLGPFDGNNWLSFIVGHGRRHTQQMKEIIESVPK